MRKAFALLPLLCLAACEPAKTDQQPVENAIPATPAPKPATPGPVSAAPEETPLNPPAPGQPGGLADDRAPISEAPMEKGGAQEAANVAQTYYALLEEGQYTQAWALWGDHGARSNQTAADFAASFRQYSEYHANIGAPGQVDAGAGQRYVEVPVQVYGRLKANGQPFNQRGAVTLHRVGDVDGATAEQKSWRISQSTVNPPAGAALPPAPPPVPVPAPKPRPDPGPKPTPGVPDFVTANYRCDGGVRLTIDFDNKAGTATVRGGGRKSRAVMKIRPVASGVHYAGNGYDLRGKGDDATWTAPGATAISCKAGR